MHDTAATTGEAFFRCYGDPLMSPALILEVGSLDLNGTLRPPAPQDCQYIGIDMVRGPAVDAVAQGWSLPFGDSTFDLVVSSSCLEHDPMFWLTFAEMARVVRDGGFIYASVPAGGPYHAQPVDCWRFYDDAGKALTMWAKRQGYALEQVEGFFLLPEHDIWIDTVMVWGKEPVPSRTRITDHLQIPDHVRLNFRVEA